MSKFDDKIELKRQIASETDAEIAFGKYLELSNVDYDDFLEQWRINQNQFNLISHFLYGLNDDVSSLPPALAVILKAIRQLPNQPIAA